VAELLAPAALLPEADWREHVTVSPAALPLVR